MKKKIGKKKAASFLRKEKIIRKIIFWSFIINAALALAVAVFAYVVLKG